SFLICSFSSVYFLIYPDSGPLSPILIFNKTTWDLIHTWSGVLMTVTAILHLALHWKWVTNITKKMFTIRKAVPTEIENQASAETLSIS
ncbi:MAG: DUF4405 domain-containing protein, partial [Anaerolineales bacterium]